MELRVLRRRLMAKSQAWAPRLHVWEAVEERAGGGGADSCARDHNYCGVSLNLQIQWKSTSAANNLISALCFSILPFCLKYLEFILFPELNHDQTSESDIQIDDLCNTLSAMIAKSIVTRWPNFTFHCHIDCNPKHQQRVCKEASRETGNQNMRKSLRLREDKKCHSDTLAQMVRFSELIFL